LTAVRAVSRYRAAVAAAVVTVALAGLPSSPRAASGPDVSAAPVEFLRDFTIALPPGWNAPVRLVVPSLPDALLDKAGPASPRFAVGPGDAVWFGVDPGVLIHATRGYPLRPGVEFSDIAVLDGGGLLVATGDAVGFLAIDAPAEGAGQGTVAFQPIVTLPVAEARLSAGPGGGLYLFGRGKEGGLNDVYLLAPEADPSAPGAPRLLRSLRKVFSTAEKVSAVAGNGEDTFVATGRLVVKRAAGEAGVSPVLLHPKEEITGLARTRSGLLFYATPSGVGVVTPGGAVDFVKAPNPAIRAVGDELYILLRNAYAVVKVAGTEAFRSAPIPASARKKP
jgi:hypothetical protein